MGARAPTPFYLLLVLSSVCAELQVSVVSPQTATLGLHALLECTFTVGQPSVTLNHLAVVWSLEGKDLLRFGDGLKVFEPRASIDEAEIQNGNASLVLSNVTVADEGTYRCSVIYSPKREQQYITLNLHEEKKEHSMIAVIMSLLAVVIMVVLGVFLFNLRRKEMKLCDIQGPEIWMAGKQIELSCVGHHCPKDTKIKWIKIHKGNKMEIRGSTGSEQHNIEPLLNLEYTVQSSKSSEGHGYETITSTLFFTASLENHEGAIFKFNLQTKDQKTNAEKEFTEFRVQDFPGHPELNDITVSRLISGEEATLQCTVQGYFPEELQVQWLKVEKGNDGPATLSDGEGGYKLEHTAPSHGPGVSLSSTASLTFTPQLPRDQESEFICRVSHCSLEMPMEKSTGKLAVLAVPKPAEIKMVASGKTSNKNTCLALEVTGFHPHRITVVWCYYELPDSRPLGLPCTNNITKQSDGRYSLMSICQLSLEEVKTWNGEVTATIQHHSLRHPLKKTIQLGNKDTVPELDKTELNQ